MKLYLTLIVFLLIFSRNAFPQCACCSGAGLGSSTGTMNNSGLTLNKKQLIGEMYGECRNIKDVGTPEIEESLLRSMFITTLGARYGITKNFTVSALLPYVFLNTNSGSDNGIGDLTLAGTYKIFSKDNLSMSVLAGIEFPTGIQKASAFDNTTVVVGYTPPGSLVESRYSISNCS